jgi:putative ABC transport system permease protein
MSWWIRFIARLYPRSWRQRYGAELDALIEDTGPGWRVAMDLARGAAIMHLTMGLAPLRQHVRRLGATPAFTLTALLTLSVAIGANALIFSLVNGVLLRPLPFEEPERLVGVWHVAPGLAPGPVNQAAFTYFTYRDSAETLEDIGLWAQTPATITGRSEPEEVQALGVTDGTLPLLRVTAALGRRFTADDDAPGSRETVMVSHNYWQRAFGGDTRAIGQSLVVDGRPREIIGVLPAGFRLLRHSPDLLLPLRLNRATVQIGLFRYQAIARLKPGVTLEHAHADLARLIPGMPDRFPIPAGFSREMYDGFKMVPDVHPLSADLIGDVSGMLWILFGAVLMLLLVAGANVANLVLVRAEAQRQALAVQLALGAGSARIAAQILGEALLLSGASGACGLLLAQAGLQAIRAIGPGGLPRLDEVTLDLYVMGFTAAITAVAGVLFSLGPIARHARADLSDVLKENGRGSSDGRARQHIRNTLVVAQVAIAFVLLVGSGLMVRTFIAIRGVDPGFRDAANVLTVRISIPEAVVAEPAAVARVHDQILRGLVDVGGVQAAGVTSSVTTDGANRRDPLFVDARELTEGQMPPLRRMKWTAPGYFAVVGNRLIAGRDFVWDEVHGPRHVAIVSDNLARELFGGAQSALGQRVRPSPNGPWREIVGVVGNEYDDGPMRPAPPIVYWPFMQHGYAPSRTTVERTLVYAIRTERANDPALLGELQRAVWAVDPTLPLTRVETLQDVYARSTAQMAFTLTTLAVAASMTLLVGVVGLYGVIAYVVTQRRREVGIRMALGAGVGEVQRLFLMRGLVLVIAGLAAGTALAAVASRALGAMLFEVGPLDPVAYLAAGAGLGTVAVLAIWLPARAATRVPLGIVLRG